MQSKRITSEEIRGAVARFIIQARKEHGADVAPLGAGAVLLFATPDGWALEWRRNHARAEAGAPAGSESVARYIIAPDVLAARGLDGWIMLGAFLGERVAGSARAINSNAGRSAGAKRKAAMTAMAARNSKATGALKHEPTLSIWKS